MELRQSKIKKSILLILPNSDVGKNLCLEDLRKLAMGCEIEVCYYNRNQTASFPKTTKTYSLVFFIVPLSGESKKFDENLQKFNELKADKKYCILKKSIVPKIANIIEPIIQKYDVTKAGEGTSTGTTTKDIHFEYPENFFNSELKESLKHLFSQKFAVEKKLPIADVAAGSDSRNSSIKKEDNDESDDRTRFIGPHKEPMYYVLLRITIGGVAGGMVGVIVYACALAIQAAIIETLAQAWFFGLLGMTLGTAPISAPLLLGLVGAVVSGFLLGASAILLIEIFYPKEIAYKNVGYRFEQGPVSKKLENSINNDDNSVILSL